MRRYLIVLPSLTLGSVAALWLSVTPSPYLTPVAFGPLVLITLFLTSAIVLVSALLMRVSRSYRYAYRLLAATLATLRLRKIDIWVLAALSGLGEELFFRGVLLPYTGNWVQALLFGLLHPAGIRGWMYTLYTLVVGLLLGYATMVTGSVWPAVLTHAAVNGVGLYWIWCEGSAPPRG